MKKFLSVLLLLSILLCLFPSLVACDGTTSEEKATSEEEATSADEQTEHPDSSIKKNGSIRDNILAPEGFCFSDEITNYVLLNVEGYGQIVVELYPDVAPITVANFQKLVDEGFYDGLVFHRVIYNFMIQGGDPEGTGYGGSDEKIKGEFYSNGVPNNLSHKRGVISMARSEDPNSASSQFFICHADSTHLDGDYAAFGEVIFGMETVDAIASVDTYGSYRPLEDVVIRSMQFVLPIEK